MGRQNKKILMSEIYQCIKQNKYGFKLGEKYIFNRESEIYLPSSDEASVIDVIVFEHDMWIPKYDFEKVFQKLQDVRLNKINSIFDKKDNL
jgi:hypothetical protein